MAMFLTDIMVNVCLSRKSHRKIAEMMQKWLQQFMIFLCWLEVSNDRMRTIFSYNT